MDFETEVMMIPQFDPDNPQMISQGPSICIFNKDDPQEVLASWLFTQYLLTNSVQIPYSQTEGYVPVTTRAQNSAEYQDYLSRAGEDNDTYYQVKIDAAKLLLDHLDDTFITPVFNGSASLRNAAGQLIEDVTKSERRNQTSGRRLHSEALHRYPSAVSPGFHIPLWRKTRSGAFAQYGCGASGRYHRSVGIDSGLPVYKLAAQAQKKGPVLPKKASKTVVQLTFLKNRAIIWPFVFKPAYRFRFAAAAPLSS